ncbi:Predicted methyltransferase [gamma proteobacterium HdN1]|nr:Predicted methyltransferase [gamma proteobacterium HdN1]
MSFYEDRIFPHVMEWGARPFRRSCAEVMAYAQGRVLEIGVGTGANLRNYPEAVTEVIGIEPSDAMLQIAHERLQQTKSAFRWELQQADARSLPFETASFDTVVAILVFCTIPDPERAAAEAFRALKPGGRLVFFEHVVSPDSGLARWQHRINPTWRKLACGCEINRDTRSLFERAGFRFENIKAWQHPKIVSIAASVIAGVGVRP